MGWSLSPRVVAILAVVAVPLAWFLALCSAVIWDQTGDDPGEGPWAFRVVGDWLLSTFPLFRDGEPVWGWRELFWVGPALSLPVAFRIARQPFPTRTGRAAARTMAWSMALATFLVGLTYITNGPGWPFDLLSILIATVAATVAGVSALRHRGALPRSQAIALTCALPLMPPMALLGMGYPSPAIFLGLLVALAWVAISAARQQSRAKLPEAPSFYTRSPL